MGERKVGVAVDFSKCSREALKWAVDNVARKGDHLILLNIKSLGNYDDCDTQLWHTAGSPLIPLKELSDAGVMKKYGVTPDTESLDIVNNAATQKEITIVMKIFWGDPRDKICEAVDKIPLNCLVIGNRGLGKLQRVIMGSVSNFVVDNANCPVTVVKHSDFDL